MERLERAVNTLGSGEPVHLQHADLKVSAGTEGRVVEGLAHVCFAESNVFVHPYRLPPTENTYTNLWLKGSFKAFNVDFNQDVYLK